MKKLMRLIIALLCIISTLAACSKPDAYDIHNNPIYFANYHGKWILINYWAKWCKPCYEEIPQLNQLVKTYPKQVIVFGVNFDNLPNTQLRQFAKHYQVKFPLLGSNPGPSLGITHIRALPATYIINPQGKLVESLFGPQTANKLATMLGLKSPN